MRKQLLSSVAALALVMALGGPGFAGSNGAYFLSPVPVADWTGFYVGGIFGAGAASFENYPHDGSTNDGLAPNNPSGLLGGIQAGYNWQKGNLVFGVEADLTATGWSELSVFPFNDQRIIQNDVGLLGSIRGRLGLPMDSMLLYVTGGLAFSNASYIGISPAGTFFAGSFDRFGGVVGAGVEMMLGDNISVRAEALHYMFNSDRYYGTETPETDNNLSTFVGASVFRIGASKYFD